jgi:hypothetical protein
MPILIDYIFPDDGQHKILLQLYKNTIPFTVASSEIFIPHSSIHLAHGTKIDFLAQFIKVFLVSHVVSGTEAKAQILFYFLGLKM